MDKELARLQDEEVIYNLNEETPEEEDLDEEDDDEEDDKEDDETGDDLES